jgi:hypothetical protein
MPRVVLHGHRFECAPLVLGHAFDVVPILCGDCLWSLWRAGAAFPEITPVGQSIKTSFVYPNLFPMFVSQIFLFGFQFSYSLHFILALRF